MTTIKYP